MLENNNPTSHLFNKAGVLLLLVVNDAVGACQGNIPVGGAREFGAVLEEISGLCSSYKYLDCVVFLFVF